MLLDRSRLFNQLHLTLEDINDRSSQCDSMQDLVTLNSIRIDVQNAIFVLEATADIGDDIEILTRTRRIINETTSAINKFKL